jgi:hypothetical protein
MTDSLKNLILFLLSYKFTIKRPSPLEGTEPFCIIGFISVRHLKKVCRH